MIQDMNKTLTRLFTIALLMMVSMGAWAEVKVLFGVNGTELQSAKDGTVTLGQKELTGGTVIISQEDQKNGTTELTLAVPPDKGYRLAENGLEVYTVAPADISQTRTVKASTKLDIKSEDFKDEASKRTYTATIDSNLALWLKSANFQLNREGGAKSTTHPYEGVWYLTNNNKTSKTYYVVPAANPQITIENHVSEDAYFSSDYSQEQGDPEKPFLTTFMTGGDLNSIWVLMPVSNKSNYYYIVHAKTGKYLKYQTYLTGSDARRKYVHLETISSPGETEQFEITELTESGKTGVKIKPQNNSMCFNIAAENQDRYNGYAEGVKAPYYSGIIGGMNGTDGGSLFMLGDAKCPAPTINYDSEANTYTISYDKIPVGFDILYTTNGDEPSIGGINTTTVPTTTERSTGTITVEGAYTVKAVVARYGFILTETASLPVGTPPDPTIAPTPGDCNNTVTIDSGDFMVYYTLDGTEPDNNSLFYTGPFVPDENATIKAIAYNGNLHSGIATYVNNNPLYTSKPTIIQSGNTVTITGTGTFYYTLNGVEPTTGSTEYTNPFTLSGNSGDVITIKAVAKEGDKELSCVVEKSVTMGYFISNLSQLEAISSHLGDICILIDDIDATNLSASISGFTGVFDGGYYTISGLNKPLFSNLNGGVVKNVKFTDVNITSGANVGAICDEADGATKIFNCGVLSGSVTGTNAGGLVGHIKSGTSSNVRVVNCYNYGDVSGTDYAAGIVGWNEGTVGNVRIALCMMYGTVSDATTISPVYAGNHTSNAKNFTEYNYYLYSTEKDADGQKVERIPYTKASGTTPSAYNDQLAIDKEEYLTRFPFYRHILNTHRELAAYFLFANNTTEGNVSGITVAQVNEIGHWAVKKGDDAHKYPIIELWEKNRKSTPTRTNNDLPNTTADYAGRLLTTMGSSGYLNVSIKIGGHSYSANLPITDMDTLRYDYNYGKVILPFANEYEINTDYSKICTGWKITKVGNNTSSSVTNYNFADRDNLQKDIYNESTNPFIYAQGGYYIVPTGVTSIEITANFATAYYLSDATYEIGYNSSYGERTGLGGNVPAFQGQPLYNTLTEAVAALTITTDNPHKQAIVLVGNYHYDLATETLKSYTGKGFTLMSIDADNNQEPDYGFYSIGPERPQMPPLRFDFVPIISLGMAAKVNGSYYYPGVPVWKSRGWYEQTETTVSIMNQFELDSGNFNKDENGTGQNPCIINGGYFVQMIRSNKTNCSKVSYFKIGGNAYVKEFYPGAHSNTSNITTTIVPVNVTGGQVDECFMTGYRSGGKAIGSDIRFWCSGGKIGKFLGAYMDKPMQTSGSDGNVNMTAQVDHALIGRFFGGGTSQNATITGDINVTINNSKVDFYCGGPEFGDMEEGKAVETTANNTKFGNYYGAGFGGTSITYSPKDGELTIGRSVTFSGYTYNSSTDGLKRLSRNGSLGLATCYKFEFLMHSFNKQKVVARFITGYADFSLATTGNVTNTLTGCTVENDFYGAGCQGTVNGTVTSTLTNCTIKRSAFGGGYKAVSNEVKVYPAAAPTLSIYNGETGIFSEFGTTTPAFFTWVQGTGDNPTADEANTKLKTSKNVTMAELGNVAGTISLTIDGGYVGGTVQGETPEVPPTATTAAIPAGGNVYGGGNESKSLSNATVTLKGDAVIYGDVFGGGNKADVQGSATVNIQE